MASGRRARPGAGQDRPFDLLEPAERDMDRETEHSVPDGEPRLGAAGRVLLALSVASVVAAGLLLWNRQGQAVFSDMVLAAFAWCF
jgi:hypothetical protein